MQISYWVIAPEFGTDHVTAAIRGSWLRTVEPQCLFFCVANNSASQDPTLHRLPLYRKSNTPMARDSFFVGGRLLSPVRRERYNTFLRKKVFLMLKAMADRAVLRSFDFGMLLDADTAVNVSNLQLFVDAMPGGADQPTYTGRCQQEGLTHGSSTEAMASTRTGAASSPPRQTYFRQDVAEFIELRKQNAELAWPLTIPPSPGGGPGLLFSRALLAAVQPQLTACKPFTTWKGMGDTIFSGGDSMLTRCMATLGFRCSSEKDLRFDELGRCPFRHGCSLASLFRKNPPWFYVAASSKRKQLEDANRFGSDVYGLSAPLEETIAFHHVKPTSRSTSFKPDARCAVRMKQDPSARAGWWGSSCLPHFCLVGALGAGTDVLLGALNAHPEVVRASFEGLDFFSIGGRVQQLLDKARLERAVDVSSAKAVLARLLLLYSNHFPLIDPRDFRLTGDASPEYFYDPMAATFFAQPNMRLHRVIIMLRNPVVRAVLDMQSNKHVASAGSVLAAARNVLAQCNISVLYSMAASRTVQHDLTSPCAGDAFLVHSSRAWNALLHSWYHLFLPAWIQGVANQPLVLFTEELLDVHSASQSFDRLANFMRLRPAALSMKIGEAESLANASRAASIVSAANDLRILHELMGDTVLQTDAMLRLAGHRGVPATWRMAL